MRAARRAARACCDVDVWSIYLRLARLSGARLRAASWLRARTPFGAATSPSWRR